MKAVTILLTLVVAIVYARPEKEQGFYNLDFDDLNVKEMVENEDRLKNFIKCFLGEAECTPDGGKIKDLIPEALRTKCAKCAPKQIAQIRLVAQAFHEKLPELWNKLVQNQDPKGEFKESIEEILKG